MPESRLPQGGTNLFQAIKAKSNEAEAKGIKLIKLSIGQPSGPAAGGARMVAAAAILSNKEAMHEYQDNGSPGVPNFAQRFVAAHMPTPNYFEGARVSYLPIPGIKPMLGVTILACGDSLNSGWVMMMTNPGYPTPRDQAKYLGRKVIEPELGPENNFRPDIADLRPNSQLIMFNFPHNPSGQIATRSYWHRVCERASALGIRVFNDGAYAALTYNLDACTLSEVAIGYPNLSWAEAFSASKLSNLTGWRIGAMVGSPDFIGDIATIKGNTDSGFAAPLAAGALDLIENEREAIDKVRSQYLTRIELLVGTLDFQGMKLAVEPGAGFFTLWKVPTQAFGQRISTAEEFNYLMIENTGVVGVHFNPNYIRYAVTGPVEDYRVEINQAFERAQVSYD